MPGDALGDAHHADGGRAVPRPGAGAVAEPAPDVDDRAAVDDHADAGADLVFLEVVRLEGVDHRPEGLVIGARDRMAHPVLLDRLVQIHDQHPRLPATYPRPRALAPAFLC